METSSHPIQEPNEIDFSQFEGKVLLIVNTASKCSFTSLFTGLRN
ncbi:MAG: hypothetical protein IKG99_04770 [Bacteroidaceae bacterium]|nr:hypothetical protein [Bacteroidaceae bacterium]